MNGEEELYELPRWVKLINRLIKGEKRLEDERSIFDRSAGSEGV